MTISIRTDADDRETAEEILAPIRELLEPAGLLVNDELVARAFDQAAGIFEEYARLWRLGR